MKFYLNYDQQRQDSYDPYTSPPYTFTNPLSPNYGYRYSLIEPLSTTTQINTGSLDWQNNFQIARHWKITAGLQGDNSTVSQYTTINDYGFAPDYAPVTDATTIQNSLTHIGGYVESLWEPVTGLNVTSSVRDDHYSDYTGAFSWRQGVSYRVAPTQTLVHMSGASSYTPPSESDLYYPGSSNPNLKPESSLGWEAGVEQPLLGGKVTPSATYFHNNITDYIQYESEFQNGSFVYIPKNVDRTTTEGVEVDLNAKPLDNLTLDLNYTYLTAENDTTDTRLLNRPRNSFNFTGEWNPVAPLTLTLGGSWVVGRVNYDENPADATWGYPVNAPDYFVLRASATYRVNRYLSLWVRGDNITNTQYQPILGYPALGAAVYGGVKVSF
jgi:vitamin B12 transporter